MDITNYIKPELLSVAIACYFAGMALKNTTIIKDKWIPFVLGALSILFCVIYVAATADITGWQSALLAVFTALTQGILLAGASTYIDQLLKQGKKEE